MIGVIRATVHDADGSVFSVHDYWNTDTYYARSTIAGWLASTKSTSSAPPPTQIGAGNGLGTPSPADTALWSPIPGTQIACDSISISQGYTATFNKAYTSPTGAYTEVGLFDANNNLWAHAAINEFLSSGQTLTIQWGVLFLADTSNAYAVATLYALTTVVNWLAGLQTTITNPPPTKIQVGTGSGTVTSSDTALWTPTTGTLKTCDFINISANYNVQYSLTYLSTDPNGTYTESGLFDVNGNLWIHSAFNPSAVKSGSLLFSVLSQIAVNGD